MPSTHWACLHGIFSVLLKPPSLGLATCCLWGSPWQGTRETGTPLYPVGTNYVALSMRRPEGSSSEATGGGVTGENLATLWQGWVGAGAGPGVGVEVGEGESSQETPQGAPVSEKKEDQIAAP